MVNKMLFVPFSTLCFRYWLCLRFRWQHRNRNSYVVMEPHFGKLWWSWKEWAHPHVSTTWIGDAVCPSICLVLPLAVDKYMRLPCVNVTSVHVITAFFLLTGQLLSGRKLSFDRGVACVDPMKCRLSILMRTYRQPMDKGVLQWFGQF